MQFSRKPTPLLGLATLAALGMAVAQPAMAQTTVVSPSNLNGWSTENTNTATSGFVNGPATPPAGVGSYEMSTGNGLGSGQGGKAYISTSAFNGTPLSALDSSVFTYSTYITNNSTNSIIAPAIDLQVDLDGNGTRDTTFVYEPYYSTTANGSTQSNVTTGAWQTWDAASGNWWYTKNYGTHQSAGAEYVPLSTLIANYPNAKIVDWYSAFAPEGSGFSFVAGESSGATSKNFDGNIDNLTIGTQKFDFDPNASTPAPEPSSVAAFAFTGLGALGLIFRARKRNPLA